MTWAGLVIVVSSLTEAQTIAQVLASADYRSFASGKWHLGHARSDSTWVRRVLWDSRQREAVF